MPAPERAREIGSVGMAVSSVGALNRSFRLVTLLLRLVFLPIEPTRRRDPYIPFTERVLEVSRDLELIGEQVALAGSAWEQ